MRKEITQHMSKTSLNFTHWLVQMNDPEIWPHLGEIKKKGT